MTAISLCGSREVLASISQPQITSSGRCTDQRIAVHDHEHSLCQTFDREHILPAMNRAGNDACKSAKFSASNDNRIAWLEIAGSSTSCFPAQWFLAHTSLLLAPRK